MKNVHLSISGKGIVKLVIPHSDLLTNLATDIRGSLTRAGIHHSPRFDFPDAAHITIGRVDPKKAHKLNAKLNQCIHAKQITVHETMKTKEFPVNEFVLLKSNRPAATRKYAFLSAYSL